MKRNGFQYAEYLSPFNAFLHFEGVTAGGGVVDMVGGGGVTGRVSGGGILVDGRAGGGRGVPASWGGGGAAAPCHLVGWERLLSSRKKL